MQTFAGFNSQQYLLGGRERKKKTLTHLIVQAYSYLTGQSHQQYSSGYYNPRCIGKKKSIIEFFMEKLVKKEGTVLQTWMFCCRKQIATIIVLCSFTESPAKELGNILFGCSGNLIIENPIVVEQPCNLNTPNLKMNQRDFSA